MTDGVGTFRLSVALYSMDEIVLRKTEPQPVTFPGGAQLNVQELRLQIFLNERIIRLEYTGGRLQTRSVGRYLKVRQLRSRADSALDCLAEVEQGFAIGSAFTDHFVWA